MLACPVLFNCLFVCWFVFVTTGEYVINPSFDDELQDIANKKKRIVKKIKEREDEVRIALGDPSSFKIDNDKTHGWFFRISRKVIYSHK